MRGSTKEECCNRSGLFEFEMIFDGLESCAERKESQSRSGRISEFETSIDCLWQERRAKLNQRNFSDCYKTFRVSINESFFTRTRQELLAETRVLTRRQRKIAKKGALPTLSSGQQRSETTFRSVRDIGRKAKALEPVEEERDMERYTSSIHNLDELENQLAQKGQAQSMVSRLTSLCSFQRFKSMRQICLLDKAKTLSTAPHSMVGKENLDSIRSLESFEAPGRHRPSSPTVQQKKCPCCKKQFALRDEVAVVSACQHVFHEICLKNALDKVEELEALRCPHCAVNL